MGQRAELLYFFEGKSKNRRVAVYMARNENDFIFFNIKTRRLVDFKTRNIIVTDNIYSYQTFRSIFEMMSELFSNQYFKDLTNKYLVEMKGDIMNVKTNVETRAF